MPCTATCNSPPKHLPELRNQKLPEAAARIPTVNLCVGNLENLIDENHAIVSSFCWSRVLCKEELSDTNSKPNLSLAQTQFSVVGLLQDDVDPMVSVMKVEKAPLETYANIGGLDAQKREIKEAVELPLTPPELYVDISTKPPKGVILYGGPGTGKTLLAKDVFFLIKKNSGSCKLYISNFSECCCSELIQKYLGDGPKLVRELFRLADDLSPSIVFINEIDAVGTKRYDAHSGCELDGFNSRGDVKVILATNAIESLDPALFQPGRIDRKIEFPLPDIKTRRRIFQDDMADGVNLEKFFKSILFKKN
ncbi:hypothetical protein DCAR_0100313 [Daucus carota subsp. sativus]|uniref:AAA+ ATPase domain-containing protein n=1 Tax=Daucus carota subsp. sativus TaxID=79200 RepID=A0AAF0W3J9_DAUCS|nr:hypothetical protein DCAR_0100313 [Daucus carota subsp. sativus]